MVDTANSTGDNETEESNPARKTTRKKAAKKLAKASSKNGSSASATAKVSAKRSAGGGKTKVKSQAEAGSTKSHDKVTVTATKKRSRKSPAKKVKTSPAVKPEDRDELVTNDSTESDNHSKNRTPISSAPQAVIDVSSATPDARKRGWWSRSE